MIQIQYRHTTQKYYLGGEGEESPYYPVGADCVLYHSYWDGTAVDHSIYGNDGEVNGAEFVENGLYFDGVDDVVTFTPINLGKVAASMFAWVNMVASSYKLYIVIGGAYINPANFFSFPLYKTQSIGLANPYVSILAMASGPGEFQVPVFHGAWALMGLTYDGSKVDVYKNGEFAATKNGTFTSDLVLSQVGNMDTLTYDCNGLIGSVLIFNSIKSATDHLNYYNATKARYGL